MADRGPNLTTPSQLEQPAYIHAHGINPACKLPAAADLHIGVVCRQLHGGGDNFATKVLVDQARAGELGGEAVAKHLAEAALVVVKPQGLCIKAGGVANRVHSWVEKAWQKTPRRSRAGGQTTGPLHRDVLSAQQIGML